MTYTVLAQARADLEGTLARIAAIGYTGVETYGIVERFGPARVRRALDAAGLELTSAHTPFPAGPDAERILDENAELGATVLVWSMEAAEFADHGSVEAGVARVNEAAERAAARGMTVAYHNHAAEFACGRYELLLELLDERVVIELDAYWARSGGADPAAVLERLGDRVRLVHLRDALDGVQVPIGSGAIDWAGVLAASQARWHLVELEDLQMDVFAALQRSHDHLVAL